MLCQIQTSQFVNISNFDSDWFSHHIRATPEKHKIGTMYRLMAKGRDAYLPSTKVFEQSVKFGGIGSALRDPKEVEDDMGIMKGFAKTMVKQLLINHSMLDVEQEGIEYLTCSKVERAELPWVEED